MYEICAKHKFGGNIYVRSKYSCVRSSYGQICLPAQHSLENIGGNFCSPLLLSYDIASLTKLLSSISAGLQTHVHHGVHVQ